MRKTAHRVFSEGDCQKHGKQDGDALSAQQAKPDAKRKTEKKNRENDDRRRQKGKSARRAFQSESLSRLGGMKAKVCRREAVLFISWRSSSGVCSFSTLQALS